MQAGAHHRHQADGEDQVGEAEQDIDDARDHAVDPAAEIAGGKPGEDADRRRDADHGGADEDRDARAVDDARQDVAAERVAAEQVAPFAALDPCRRLQAPEQVGLVGIVRRDQRREDAPSATKSSTTTALPGRAGWRRSSAGCGGRSSCRPRVGRPSRRYRDATALTASPSD